MKGFSLAEALSHNARRKNTNPTRLIVGSFLAVILCGTLLLMLPVSNRDGQMLDMLDAMFTATSATCVTGLAQADTFLHWTAFGQGESNTTLLPHFSTLPSGVGWASKAFALPARASTFRTPARPGRCCSSL